MPQFHSSMHIYATKTRRTSLDVTDFLRRNDKMAGLLPAAGASSDKLAYGRYLAGPLGHCVECHFAPGA